ncbi:unnamed protein product [Peniophora sp. CBMAI 1063]|nr:unnamed protein product [Peniophora sp. CBMAI 1063]
MSVYNSPLLNPTSNKVRGYDVKPDDVPPSPLTVDVDMDTNLVPLNPEVSATNSNPPAVPTATNFVLVCSQEERDTADEVFYETEAVRVEVLKADARSKATKSTNHRRNRNRRKAQRRSKKRAVKAAERNRIYDRDTKDNTSAAPPNGIIVPENTSASTSPLPDRWLVRGGIPEGIQHRPTHPFYYESTEYTDNLRATINIGWMSLEKSLVMVKVIYG